mgnify:CR=1 FL=1
MTRTCKICRLHSFLLGWVEGLIGMGLSLREVAETLNEHGLNISYQTVRRHKLHMNLKSKIERLKRRVERYKRGGHSLKDSLKRYRNQQVQLESWIQAESNPPQEALDAKAELDKEIKLMEKVIRLQDLSKKIRLLH